MSRTKCSFDVVIFSQDAKYIVGTQETVVASDWPTVLNIAVMSIGPEPQDEEDSTFN